MLAYPNVWQHMLLYACISYHMLGILTYVSMSSYMLAYGSIPYHTQAYASICQHMLTYGSIPASISWHVQNIFPYVHISWQCVGICQHGPAYISICLRTLPHAGTCCHMSYMCWHMQQDHMLAYPRICQHKLPYANAL